MSTTPTVEELQDRIASLEGEIADLKDRIEALAEEHKEEIADLEYEHRAEIKDVDRDAALVEDVATAARRLLDWCEHGRVDGVFNTVLKVEETSLRDALGALGH